MLAILIIWAFGLPTSNAQTLALTDATAVPVNVKAAALEYKGRTAVLIIRDWLKPGEAFKDGFALLKGVDLQDGTIEGEIALNIVGPLGAGECPALSGRIPGAAGRLALPQTGGCGHDQTNSEKVWQGSANNRRTYPEITTAGLFSDTVYRCLATTCDSSLLWGQYDRV